MSIRLFARSEPMPLIFAARELNLSAIIWYNKKDINREKTTEIKVLLR